MVLPLTFGGATSPVPAGPILTDLKLWYKADKETYQDNNLTIPAIANGDPVLGWKEQVHTLSFTDFKGNTNTPTLITNAQNGLSAVNFTTASLITDSTDVFTIDQPYTVFVAMKANATGAGGAQRLWLSVNTTVIMNFNGTSGKWAINAPNVISGGTADTDNNIFTCVFNGASSSIIKNRTQIASGNAGTNSLVRLNMCDVPTGGLDMRMYEFLCYSGALSAGDITTVTDYLSTRWGLGI